MTDVNAPNRKHIAKFTTSFTHMQLCTPPTRTRVNAIPIIINDCRKRPIRCPDRTYALTTIIIGMTSKMHPTESRATLSSRSLTAMGLLQCELHPEANSITDASGACSTKYSFYQNMHHLDTCATAEGQIKISPCAFYRHPTFGFFYSVLRRPPERGC